MFPDNVAKKSVGKFLFSASFKSNDNVSKGNASFIRTKVENIYFIGGLMKCVTVKQRLREDVIWGILIS